MYIYYIFRFLYLHIYGANHNQLVESFIVDVIIVLKKIYFRPKSWPWSNFVPGTRNTDVKIIVSDKNEEEGSIELLPYEVLEKTFVST